MKEELAQSHLDAVEPNLESSSNGTDASGGRLTEDDVLRRLFAPAVNLPEPRNDKAIVVVSAGGTERAVTHRQLENLFGHAIDQLKEQGVKEGDKIIFYCENCPEYTSTVLACWSLNAVATFIDSRAERGYVLAMSKKLDAKLLITSKKLYKDFALETKLFTETGIAVLDVLPFSKFKDNAPKSQFDIQALNLDQPAFAILTSGTTGAPKTAVHTLRSLVQNIIDLAEAAGQQGKITALTPLPLSHIFGLTVFLIAQILGAKTILTQLEPVGFVKAVHRHKPEWIAALPQFYGALLSAPKGYINLSNTKLLLCGGAPLTVSLADKFEETFGKLLNNGYGSTECKLVAFNKGGPALCIGNPVGTIKIDIINEQDEVVPDGKVGEVRITGLMFMDGYLDNDQESKKVLHNGRYYTGDIGRAEDGNLFVIGRKDDVVLVGGVVVKAGVVEDALRKYKEVKDVAVTAVSNKRLGQIVKASVVLVDDKITDKLKSSDRDESHQARRQLEQQFRAYCKEHLSRYERPMKWEFFASHDSLPKTLAGKTDKKKMSGVKSA